MLHDPLDIRRRGIEAGGAGRARPIVLIGDPLEHPLMGHDPADRHGVAESRRVDVIDGRNGRGDDDSERGGEQGRE